MPVRCSNCAFDNANGQLRYCIRCGSPLSAGDSQNRASASFSDSTLTAGQALFPPAPGTANTQRQQWQYPPVTPPASGTAQGGIFSQYGSAPQTAGIGSVRRAFAGHGVLIKHHSWLLNGQSSRSGDVGTAIMEKISQRNQGNLGVTMTQVNLTDQSLLVERRDYIKVERKVSTVFIYVTPAGSDLYLSRATTVKPALSLLRVIALGLILLGIVVPIASIVSAAQTLTVSAAIVLWVLLAFFFSFPLLWVLITLSAWSFIYLVKDGDFLTLLRPATLTEFQRDDVALLEHETDDIVRDAVKQLSLDADKITPPSNGYEPAKRIRLI